MLTHDKAFNGTYNRAYYRTPSEFFSSSQAVGADRADTDKGKRTKLLDYYSAISQTTQKAQKDERPAYHTLIRILKFLNVLHSF